MIAPLLKHGQEALPALIQVQLQYCMEAEMCVTPADFFVRRITALYFDIETVKH